MFVCVLDSMSAVDALDPFDKYFEMPKLRRMTMQNSMIAPISQKVRPDLSIRRATAFVLRESARTRASLCCMLDIDCLGTQGWSDGKTFDTGVTTILVLVKSSDRALVIQYICYPRRATFASSAISACFKYKTEQPCCNAVSTSLCSPDAEQRHAD